jgi:uncharacterized protein (DUF2235 family)
MKRLIVCSDGTWQEAGHTFPTNVAKIAASIKPRASDGTLQVVFYSDGVGTNGLLDRIIGGGTGYGLDLHIKDAYRFLCLNYEPGDEIYLFGFSRGSYTTRSLVGLIYNSGLLRPEHLEKIDAIGTCVGAYQLYRSREDECKPGSEIAKKFRHDYCVSVDCCSGDDQGRVPIKLLACWETVGSLGIPTIGVFNLKSFFPQWLLKLFPGKYRFHDVRLSRIVLNALHAVAVDERRKVFKVTLMDKDPEKMDKNGDVLTVTGSIQGLRQVWFPGDHGSIGGGEKWLQGLSDAALAWMIDHVERLDSGIQFDLARMPFPLDPKHFDYGVHFFKINYLMIPGLFWRKINSDAMFERDVHESVKLRWRDLNHYRPKNLSQKFRGELEQWGIQNPKKPDELM